MATNIKNKADEVAAWIDTEKFGRAPTPKEIRSYIDSRWPDLSPDIRENIALAAMAQTF